MGAWQLQNSFGLFLLARHHLFCLLIIIPFHDSTLCWYLLTFGSVFVVPRSDLTLEASLFEDLFQERTLNLNHTSIFEFHFQSEPTLI